MLPLASAAFVCVSAGRCAAAFDRFDDVDERHPSPRTLVLDDRTRDNFTRHCAGDEMGLAVLSGNSFASVGHVVWVKFDHEPSVLSVDVSTALGGGIVGTRHAPSREPG